MNDYIIEGLPPTELMALYRYYTERITALTMSLEDPKYAKDKLPDSEINEELARCTDVLGDICFEFDQYHTIDEEVDPSQN